MSDDKSIVAALDTEYQEAVKNNDIATMDRILADDFALVTGNGRAYTKADLLKSMVQRHLCPRFDRLALRARSIFTPTSCDF